MPPRIAIIGAGLIGRLLALECHLNGMSVSLLDRDNKGGEKSCAHTGAGMLAPYTELELAEPIIAALGLESLNLWPKILQKLPLPVFFQQEGTLVLSHPQDQAELLRFKRSLQFKLDHEDWQKFTMSPAKEEVFFNCNQSGIITLEPDLPHVFTQGFYLPNEGQIDNKQLLEGLRSAIEKANIGWHTEINITSISQNKIECQHLKHHSKNVIDQLKSADFIVDCRGLGSKADIQQLRGVRGESIVVEAPEVTLNRPIRLMHPRHAIYIVPRQNNHFIIGATSIESEDLRPITIQSALELLSAACTIHPAFAQANIIESRVNCRPSLTNNLPAIVLPANTNAPKIIRINGLYRHGFLISPKIAQLVVGYILNGQIEKFAEPLIYKGDSTFAITH